MFFILVYIIVVPIDAAANIHLYKWQHCTCSSINRSLKHVIVLTRKVNIPRFSGFVFVCLFACLSVVSVFEVNKDRCLH